MGFSRVLWSSLNASVLCFMFLFGHMTGCAIAGRSPLGWVSSGSTMISTSSPSAFQDALSLVVILGPLDRLVDPSPGLGRPAPVLLLDPPSGFAERIAEDLEELREGLRMVSHLEDVIEPQIKLHLRLVLFLFCIHGRLRTINIPRFHSLRETRPIRRAG